MVKRNRSRFPIRASARTGGEAFALVPLDVLIELKIASGMTAPHRMRDLADVIELIRVNELPRDYAERLDSYVVETYLELWTAAKHADENR